MKEFLSRQGVPFTTRLLTDEPNRREAQRFGSGPSPLTVIDGQPFFGLEREALASALERAGLVALDGRQRSKSRAEMRLEVPTPLAGAVAVANFLGDSVTFLSTRSGGYLGPALDRSTIAVAGRPIAVEASPKFGAAAVVSYEGGTVTFLSLRDGAYLHTGLAESTRETGSLPLYAVAHPREPLLYVSNSESRSVTVFDAATGGYAFGSLERSSFPVPGQPGVMALHPEQQALFVRLREGAVVMLDARTLRPARGGVDRSTFATGRGRGIALSADGRVLYVPEALGDSDGLALYDARTGAPLFGSRERSVVPTAATPFAVATHPTKPIVYVSCFGPRVVEYRDGHTGRYLSGSYERSSVPVGGGARALLVDPQRDTLYVSCFDEDRVLMFDALSGEPRAGDGASPATKTGRGPRGMALIGRG